MHIQPSSLVIGAVCGIACFLALAFTPNAQQAPVTYTYRQFSTIESVVPMGLGRSRIITSDASGQMMEKELQNFYSATGINFKNVSNNDRVIVDNINSMTTEGWELFEVSTGVNSLDGGGGIFITRYLFRKPA